MSTRVLIDISYLAHRARYATAGLQYEDFHTGVLFGFWEQLRTICQDDVINSNNVVLYFDSRQSYRRRAFPFYKSGRHKDMTPEEKMQLDAMYAQVRLLRQEILPAIGFQIHRQTGCESDDLIAQTAAQLTQAQEPGIMVTADGDLWQCISDYVRWYDPARRKLYTPQSFRQQKGLDPIQWGLVKALAGCDGDEVPGVPRVGDKTAVKHLTQQLPPHYKAAQAIQSPEGQEIFNRNKELVILPHFKTKPIQLRTSEYNTEAFFHYCERYGFMNYLREPKKNEWELFFKGSQPRTRRRGE